MNSAAENDSRSDIPVATSANVGAVSNREDLRANVGAVSNRESVIAVSNRDHDAPASNWSARVRKLMKQAKQNDTAMSGNTRSQKLSANTWSGGILSTDTFGDIQPQKPLANTFPRTSTQRSEVAGAAHYAASGLVNAVVRQTSPSFKVYAIHADHLGTPIMMTDAQGEIVWRHRFAPFGKSIELDEDADGDGQNVTLNLRFPGQYYDKESGLHYNWHRYYDPENGRYITHEPNPKLFFHHYMYSYNNSISFVDFMGLLCNSADAMNKAISEANRLFDNYQPCFASYGLGNLAGGVGCLAGSEFLADKLNDNSTVSNCCTSMVQGLVFHHWVEMDCQGQWKDKKCGTQKKFTRHRHFDMHWNRASNDSWPGLY